MLAAGAGAETREVVFETYPSGAEVWINTANSPLELNNPGTITASESYAGKSGTPIPIDFTPFMQTGRLIGFSVTLKKPGHKDVPVYPNNDLLNTGRWPPTGRTALPPNNATVAVADFVSEYRLPVGVAAVLVVAIASFLLRQRRQLAHIRQRERRREALTAGGDPNDPLIGQKLGHYLLVSRLGAGGMAVVYRAMSEGTLQRSRAVAVKVISPAAAGDPEFHGRFVREVKVYMELSHPNIVRLIEWGEDPLHLVMELVEGSTLRHHVRREGQPVDEVVELLYPLMGAIAYAHSKGIVHRDLKPENIMLTERKQVKVMDFGLARPREVTQRLTASGAALGTPGYMSPEQINGASTPGVDQYALGIVAYELLAGRLPFEGDSMAMLFRHLSEDPPPLRGLRPDVPTGLEAMVMRMIDRDDKERFESVQAAIEELERLYPRLAEWRQRSHDPFPAGTFDDLLN